MFEKQFDSKKESRGLTNFYRVLSYVTLGIVIACCVCSLVSKTKQIREEGKTENEICSEEARESDSYEEDSEDVQDENDKEVPEWRKHHASKYEEDISVTRKGAFSLYTYSFSGEGKEHTKEEIEKYNISSSFNSPGYYSKVKSNIRIEWPEPESELSPAALAKVRRAILWMAFSQVEPFSIIPYERLKGLGETPGSILKYMGIVDTNRWEDLVYYISNSIEDGYISNSGNFYLCSFILSRDMGKLPAKEGDVVGDDCLRASLDFAKQYANECYECKPEKEENHLCSQYHFTAQTDLSWPFGLKAKEGAKWYERPVVCVNHYGYSNDGGNGDHSLIDSKVYSLPDGEELFVEDYFASDKLEELKAFVKQRLIFDWLENDEDGIEELEANKFYLGDIKVSEKGMLFQWPVYAILSLPWNSPQVFIEWKDLEPFKK